MKTPESLETLVDHGIIQEVIRPLMSGKEAQIYVVLVGDEECVAKVYKEAHQRTFKHRVEYTEGRRTRNSRDQRAVSKRTRHGRKQDEAAWRNAEVDMIYRLRAAGVRVPAPMNFLDGVLVMELVQNAQGDPAPRLGDLSFDPREAVDIYQQLIQEVVRMLCAGVIHGDLSVFNVLMAVDGPVVIDFPQSVDPASNRSARKLLLRDVENLHRFLERFAPDRPRLAYAEEMWALYESNRLDPDTRLRGDYQAPEGKANTDEVLALIDDAHLDEQIRRHGRRAVIPVRAPGAPKPKREVVDFTPETKPGPSAQKRAAVTTSVAKNDAAPKKRRSRRRRGGRPENRTQPSETRTAAASAAKRPAKPAAGARGGSEPIAAAGRSDRPARRRRRRPRATRARETT